MKRLRVYVWIGVAVSAAGAHHSEASVSNGDWKSGDFTDWNVDASQNSGQESGVGAFDFGLSDGPGGPPAPCAPQGGEGNCAAFFGVGGPSGAGEGASVFLSQDGGPPPGGTGELFLEAGVSYAFSADVAAVSRSGEPDPDGGTISVRLHPVGDPMGSTLVAQRGFGPLQPQQTITAPLTGAFDPPVSEFYVLEIEFRRELPHVPGSSPLNWIDNISLEPDGLTGGEAVPMASDWSHAGVALAVVLAGALALRGRWSAGQGASRGSMSRY